MATQPTKRVLQFNLRGGPTEGHGDLFQAGVKGHLPLVLLGGLMVGGQQVDLHGLDSLLHPLENLSGVRERTCL